jgi:competence transcription factor ComK
MWCDIVCFDYFSQMNVMITNTSTMQVQMLYHSIVTKSIIRTAMLYINIYIYRVILLVLDPRKCKYLKDYLLDFEHAYMTTYIAS